MKPARLLTLALTASTLLAGTPAGAYEYGMGHDHHEHDRGYDRRPDYGRDRDRDYRRDYDRGRYDDGPRRGDLERIGVVTARGPDHENDLLELPRCRRFTAIQFRAAAGDVKIEHIRITFGDDSAFEPTVMPVFREGDKTCRIDLPGFNREVKRVRIHYHSLTRGTAVVEVFGVVG